MTEKERFLHETTHTTVVAGQRLHYRTMGEGSGLPIVLLHGYGASGHIWRYAEPFLAQGHRLFLVDLPGFGQSTVLQAGWRRERWRLQAIAPVLAEWIRELDLRSIALVGHSMGGAIAIDLAACIPQQIERLVLVDTAGLPLQTHLPRLALRSMRSFLQIGNGGYPRELMRDMLQPRFRVHWQSAREVMRSDLRRELALIHELQIPTLIIWGKRDVLLPIDLGHRLREILPDAHFVAIPGCGHRPMLARPAEFSQAILAFLEQPGA